MIVQANLIKALCDANDTIFIINDRVNVAIETKPDGIHLGREDMDVNDVQKIVSEKIV